MDTGSFQSDNAAVPSMRQPWQSIGGHISRHDITRGPYTESASLTPLRQSAILSAQPSQQ